MKLSPFLFQSIQPLLLLVCLGYNFHALADLLLFTIMFLYLLNTLPTNIISFFQTISQVIWTFLHFVHRDALLSIYLKRYNFLLLKNAYVIKKIVAVIMKSV